MTRALAFAAGALAAGMGALAAGAARAGEVSGDAAFFGRDPGDGRAFACYVRHYTDDHLKTHPKQNVRSMMMFVDSSVDGSGRYYTLSIGVGFRKLEQSFNVSGGCSAAEGGKGLNCGVDCDGGRIDVSVRDENSILVSIPDGVAIWDPDSDEPTPDNARFGADDKLFRLDRTNVADCLPLVFDEDAKAMINATN